MFEDVVLDADTKKFTEYRKSFGTQTGVAKVIGLSDQTLISRYEIGDTDMDSRTYSLFLLVAGKHPTYTLKEKDICYGLQDLLIPAPNSANIQATRKSVKTDGKGRLGYISQGRMASLLSLSSKQIISRYEKGVQAPSLQCWTLFLLITGKHPTHYLIEKD